MITKKSVFAQVFVVMFALLLALSFAACSTTTVSGATSKTKDITLKFKGSVDDTKNTITNTYEVFYQTTAPADGYTVHLTPYGESDAWKKFKKIRWDSITVNGGSSIAYSKITSSDWEVDVTNAEGVSGKDIVITVTHTKDNTKTNDPDTETWTIKYSFKAWEKSSKTK